MAVPTWRRVIDIVGGLASRRGAPDPAAGGGGWGLAPLDVRLLGFAIGAIKKAFDHDSDRMAFEREHFEAERARADAALRLEWLRHEGDRRLAEARLVVGLAVVVWIASAGLGVALSEGYALTAKILMGFGWLALVGAIGLAMTAHRQIAGWVGSAATLPGDPPERRPVAIAMYLLVSGFAMVAASVLVAL
jgi:hypothetical protein